MNWHVDVADLVGWQAGQLDDPNALSVESHLQLCEVCRDLVAAAAPAALIAARWDALADRVDAATVGPLERLLVRLGVPHRWLRLLLTTPTLRLPWLLSVGSVVLFAAYVSQHFRAEDPWLFLALAPLVPVLGIGMAYGPGNDPTSEVAQTAPLHGLQLLLVRSLAVLVTSLLLTGIATLALPDVAAGVLATIPPSLALTGTTLALGAWLSPGVSAAVTSGSWLALIAWLSLPRHELSSLSSGAAAVTFIALSAVSLIVVALNRHTFDDAPRA